MGLPTAYLMVIFVLSWPLAQTNQHKLNGLGSNLRPGPQVKKISASQGGMQPGKGPSLPKVGSTTLPFPQIMPFPIIPYDLNPNAGGKKRKGKKLHNNNLLQSEDDQDKSADMDDKASTKINSKQSHATMTTSVEQNDDDESDFNFNEPIKQSSHFVYGNEMPWQPNDWVIVSRPDEYVERSRRSTFLLPSDDVYRVPRELPYEPNLFASVAQTMFRQENVDEADTEHVIETRDVKEEEAPADDISMTTTKLQDSVEAAKALTNMERRMGIHPAHLVDEMHTMVSGLEGQKAFYTKALAAEAAVETRGNEAAKRRLGGERQKVSQIENELSTLKSIELLATGLELAKYLAVHRNQERLREAKAMAKARIPSANPVRTAAVAQSNKPSTKSVASPLQQLANGYFNQNQRIQSQPTYNQYFTGYPVYQQSVANWAPIVPRYTSQPQAPVYASNRFLEDHPGALSFPGPTFSPPPFVTTTTSSPNQPNQQTAKPLIKKPERARYQGSGSKDNRFQQQNTVKGKYANLEAKHITPAVPPQPSRSFASFSAPVVAVPYSPPVAYALSPPSLVSPLRGGQSPGPVAGYGYYTSSMPPVVNSNSMFAGSQMASAKEGVPYKVTMSTPQQHTVSTSLTPVNSGAQDHPSTPQEVLNTDHDEFRRPNYSPRIQLAPEADMSSQPQPLNGKMIPPWFGLFPKLPEDVTDKGKSKPDGFYAPEIQDEIREKEAMKEDNARVRNVQRAAEAVTQIEAKVGLDPSSITELVDHVEKAARKDVVMSQQAVTQDRNSIRRMQIPARPNTIQLTAMKRKLNSDEQFLNEAKDRLAKIKQMEMLATEIEVAKWSAKVRAEEKLRREKSELGGILSRRRTLISKRHEKSGGEIVTT